MRELPLRPPRSRGPRARLPAASAPGEGTEVPGTGAAAFPALEAPSPGLAPSALPGSAAEQQTHERTCVFA